MIQQFRQGDSQVLVCDVPLHHASTLDADRAELVPSGIESIDESMLFGVGTHKLLVNGVVISITLPYADPGKRPTHLHVIYKPLQRIPQRVALSSNPLFSIIEFEITYVEDQEAYL